MLFATAVFTAAAVLVAVLGPMLKTCFAALLAWSQRAPMESSPGVVAWARLAAGLLKCANQQEQALESPPGAGPAGSKGIVHLAELQRRARCSARGDALEEAEMAEALLQSLLPPSFAGRVHCSPSSAAQVGSTAGMRRRVPRDVLMKHYLKSPY